MGDLIFFILCFIGLFIFFAATEFIKEDKEDKEERRIDNVDTEEDIEDDDDYYYDDDEDDKDDYYSPPSRNSSPRREEPESIDYVIQRLGGSGWLGESSGWSNVSSAIDSADSLKRRNPDDRYRVAERRNGRIVGTVYSC